MTIAPKLTRGDRVCRYTDSSGVLHVDPIGAAFLVKLFR